MFSLLVALLLCPTCTQMHARRAIHSATRLADGRVLIAGGMIHNRAVLATAEVFDPSTGQFSGTGDMPEPRMSHSAILLKDGHVLLAGGYSGDGHIYRSAVLYDPATGQFARTGDMVVPRAEASATLLPDGRVLVAGGVDAPSEVATQSAEIYDPPTGRFSPTGNMSVARAYHVAAPLPDGRVLVAGGEPDLGHTLKSAEIYDMATGTFTSAGDMLEVRRKAAATTLADGRVLIVGGSDNDDWHAKSRTAEIYDPATKAFHETGELHVPRFKLVHAVVTLDDGRVLVAGGGTGFEVYDPAHGTFTPVNAGLSAARYYSTATSLGDGRVLITGGYGDDAGESANSAYVLSM
ncbi:MAG TPA: kelch repeat-containing protein [Gemmatimonadaceae bacterium]|nr:kelch repeat-containing protein [Gemmatimonadaceae bacterium]